MSKSVYSKDYKDIIERLKTGRIETGLSQQEVADKLNKPQSFISKIESGERRLYTPHYEIGLIWYNYPDENKEIA